MEVVYAGRGPVGDRCYKVLFDLGIRPTPYQDWIVNSRYGKKDLLVSVHWNDIFDPKIIEWFAYGAVNLHNSYLPWNRGADACSWAIVDQTPHGATFHFISEGLDKGPIIYQKKLEIAGDETADALYTRTADLEVEVFKQGMENILRGQRWGLEQKGKGSYHSKGDFDRLIRAVSTRDYQVVKRG